MNTLESKRLIESISECSVFLKDENYMLIQPLQQRSTYDMGFVDWNILELGNGDVCGFYWKLGCEDENPLVCAYHHDDWALIPWASNPIDFFKLIAAHESRENSLFGNNFWFNLDELKENIEYYDINTNFLDIPKAAIIEDAIRIDPQSPMFLRYLGDICKEKGHLDLAEKNYLKALSILPEYGEVSFSLGMLYRSQRQHNLAITHLIDAFTSPYYFSEDKEKIIRLLCAYKDDNQCHSNNPIWKRRHNIKFDDGEKYPTFLKILNEAIDEYIQLQQFNHAIGLRLSLGAYARDDELLTHRYQLKEHNKLLHENLVAAGMGKRISLLGL